MAERGGQDGPRSPSVAVAKMAPFAWASDNVVEAVAPQLTSVQSTVVAMASIECRGIVPSRSTERSVAVKRCLLRTTLFRFSSWLSVAVALIAPLPTASASVVDVEEHVTMPACDH